jgi:hypothetical protein
MDQDQPTRRRRGLNRQSLVVEDWLDGVSAPPSPSAGLAAHRVNAWLCGPHRSVLRRLGWKAAAGTAPPDRARPLGRDAGSDPGAASQRDQGPLRARSPLRRRQHLLHADRRAALSHLPTCSRTRPTPGLTTARPSSVTRQDHLPGPLQELDDTLNRNAAPVSCSGWFGGESPRGLRFPAQPETTRRLAPQAASRTRR